ncbi:polyphenol oxidase A1, chloroplastic-like [Cornus florida]|uniref:polyphenol oxidase A1, chloroplastic-like n=1 Tax=Cornus florida TaxID=4283 RepID=UPI00289CD2F4|nr:polyphenol oxidase A1, chloroplastic-like [Cornus florida]
MAFRNSLPKTATITTFPLLAPDITNPNCTNCCLPITTNIKIVDFVLPRPSDLLRHRQAAHKVDNVEYLVKYAVAIERMKSLPADDQRNFMQQSNVHRAYCDGAYYQVGFPGLQFQVHKSWLFFPFHRWYLYFYEKISGKLINDPTFALPFWNYDDPDGMQLPTMYAKSNSNALIWASQTQNMRVG